MKKFALFFGLYLLFGVCSVSQAEDAIPGQIIIDIFHQYLPIYPVLNGQGVIVTAIASIDSLNAQYHVYAFEKVTDNSWNATKGFYLVKFQETRDIVMVKHKIDFLTVPD